MFPKYVFIENYFYFCLFENNGFGTIYMRHGRELLNFPPSPLFITIGFQLIIEQEAKISLFPTSHDVSVNLWNIRWLGGSLNPYFQFLGVIFIIYFTYFYANNNNTVWLKKQTSPKKCPKLSKTLKSNL